LEQDEKLTENKELKREK